MFLGPLYMSSTSFHSKTPTVHSGQNSWPVETRSIFVQNLPDFFFLLSLKNFPIVSWTAVYAIYKFLFKNTDIAFRSKFMTSRTLGHFHTKFIRVLFYFILFYYLFLKNFPFISWTTIYAIYKFSCKNGDIVFQSQSQ